MDKISESILHEYPYPIAKCYEKLVRSRDILDRRDQCRYLFEATLKYCACLAVAQYLDNGHPDHSTNAALSFLSKPSLGHWLNLFKLCVRQNQSIGKSLFAPEIFGKIKDRPGLIQGYNTIKKYIDPEKDSRTESISILPFLDVMVTYRNRSIGHGAPQRDHTEELVPVIEKAIVDLLLHLDCLKQNSLVYLSEIRVERGQFVHTLVRLMGVTQVAMPDFVTGREDALIGYDRNLFLFCMDTSIPLFTLHPLVIYSSDEVFLLQNGDLKHNVDYLCHHTGEICSADRIYEDFKEKFNIFLSSETATNEVDSEQIYMNSVRMSLVDGKIVPEERMYLDELCTRLGISSGRAQELETLVYRELGLNHDGKEPIPHMRRRIVAAQPHLNTVSKKYLRLLFFPYASVHLGFWANFVSRLAAQAQKYDMVFSMVAPDPATDYDPAAMTALVADMMHILEMHSPDLMIMVPSPSRPFAELFQKWVDNLDIPIVTIDTEFFSYDFFRKKGLPIPPIIQINNVEGGRQAGRILLQHVPEGCEKPQFLAMPGLEDAPHSRARLQGFEETIKSAYPDAKIRVLPPGGFQRQKARKVIEEFMEDVDISRYQGIFCCNDEMALGVYTALCMRWDLSLPMLHFRIVGFNNTTEMTNAMMIDRTGFLAGTIDQNLENYMETIFVVIEMLLKGEPVQERYLIPPIAVSSQISE